MDTTVYTDPVKIGPGIWFNMHIDAVYATSDLLKKNFIIKVNNICDNFKCKKCQPHFRKFIDTHPLKNYWNIRDKKGNDIGFFKWTWELHNQVNKFLNKYQTTLEESYAYYSNADSGVCFDCGKEPTITFTNVPPSNDTRYIPDIISEYKSGKVKAKPFKLISRN